MSVLRGPQGIWYGPMLYQRGNCPTSPTLFTQITGLTPSAYYPCQDASGNLVDVVNARNLSPANSPAYRRVNAGRRGIHCNSSGDGFGANVNDVGTASAIIGAIGIWTGSVAVGAVAPAMCGRFSDTTFPSVLMYRANDQLKYPTCLIRDAVDKSLVLNDTNVNVVTPERPCLYLIQVDRTNNVGRYFVADSQKTLMNLSGSIATHVTFAGGSNPLFTVGGFGSTVGPGVNLAFFATGAQCEGSTKLRTIANRLGYGN